MLSPRQVCHFVVVWKVNKCNHTIVNARLCGMTISHFDPAIYAIKGPKVSSTDFWDMNLFNKMYSGFLEQFDLHRYFCFVFFRYIAIVHPIKAHIFCSRRRMLFVISLIWPSVVLLGLPVVLFNQLVGGPYIRYCALHFPGDDQFHFIALYKYAEFFLFYLIPMVSQVICYVIIGRHLFAGSE